MNGFIVINKPAGITSATAVAKIKKRLPKKTKIGHTGTLDPNVTGVLPLAIGKATKAIAYMDDEVKVYRCTMRFGMSTDTQDIWGKIAVQTKVVPFEQTTIERLLAHFTGDIMQVPPMYSARKVDGKRLYDLARAGIEVARHPTKTTIFGFSDVDYQHPELSYTVRCARGTYVRTLCVDMADSLGTIACMSALKRLATGPFTLDQSIGLDRLENMTNEQLDNALLPINIMFDQLPIIAVDYVHAIHLVNGVKVNLARFTSLNQPYDQHYSIHCQNNFIGVAKGAGQSIRLDKIFVTEQQLKQIISRR